jgi:glycosyltransferase involved in cell wall biosynthesis
VSALQRVLLSARSRLSRRRLGFSNRNAVHEGRRASFIAGREPLSVTPRESRRYAIVVPCYNHAPYLPAAFGSIEAQTLRPSEVILVDDHSTDATWRAVNDLVAASSLPHELFRVSRNSHNLGQCATINAAVAHTTSDVVVVLNDDDYLMHDALEWIDRILAAHPAAALVGARAVSLRSQAYLDNLKKNVTGALLSSDLTVTTRDPATARRYSSAQQLMICHSGSAFRREAWEAVGGYYSDKRRRVVLFSDRDFQLRVNYLYPVAVVEDAAFAFWRAGSSVDAGLFT